MSHTDRRAFLHHMGRLGALGAAAPLGLALSAMGEAAAQSGTDYRALVCVFLYGGNDAFNTVLATDAGSWQHYLNHRDPRARNPADTGSASIALCSPGTPANPMAAASDAARLGGVLPISHAGRPVHTGRQFALHPALPRLQGIYQSGRAAVLANVGPLLAPMTKTEYESARVARPAKLFSHNDQQSTWQTFGPEGALSGWAGRMGDLLMSQNGLTAGSQGALVRRALTCISLAGATGWLNGQQVQPFLTGASSISGLGSNGAVYGSTRLHSALKEVMTSATTRNDHVRDHQDVVARSLQASDLIGSRLPAAGQGPWGTAPTSSAYSPVNDPLLRYTSPTDGSSQFSPLAQQLQMVARLIEANRTSGLGLKRQFFMVSLGGFDHHDRQIAAQAECLAQLDHALSYFDTLLGAMPGGDMRNQVTTFTASDFGRTFTSNGDGTDHGWGAHHVILGGAVRGTEVYGSFPQYSTADARGLFSSPDQIGNGVLLPSTSVGQYAYTLGRWMGVSASDLLDILPGLSAFTASSRDLGFMSS